MGLFDRIPGTPLRRFRVLFGMVQILQIFRMFYYQRIDEWFVKPHVHFKYERFEWVPVFGREGLIAQYTASALCHAVLATGKYRLPASFGCTIFQCLFFLSDRALYNNHYYLAVLLSILFFLQDVHAYAAAPIVSSARASNGIPRWYLCAFQLQIAIVYTFATLAKLSSRDWLRAYPARIWLQESFEIAVRDVFGSGMKPLPNHSLPLGFAYALSYGGIVVDGFLAYITLRIALRTSRAAQVKTMTFRGPPSIEKAACSVWILFHALNGALFDIGVFPLMMLSCLVLFFDVRCVRSRLSTRVCRSTSIRRERSVPDRGVRIFIFVFFFAQTVVPLRFLRYQSLPFRHVNWTGEGELFAWRMMLTSKRCDGRFDVFGEEFGDESNDERLLRSLRSPSELRVSYIQWWRMISDAELVRQMAVAIKKRFERFFPGTVKVRVRIACSLNGSERQLFLDPGIDFSTVEKAHIYDAVMDQTHYPP